MTIYVAVVVVWMWVSLNWVVGVLVSSSVPPPPRRFRRYELLLWGPRVLPSMLPILDRVATWLNEPLLGAHE